MYTAVLKTLPAPDTAYSAAALLLLLLLLQLQQQSFRFFQYSLHSKLHCTCTSLLLLPLLD
jgi:hypothetical protein